jgi:hypothetical protein
MLVVDNWLLQLPDSMAKVLYIIIWEQAFPGSQ